MSLSFVTFLRGCLRERGVFCYQAYGQILESNVPIPELLPGRQGGVPSLHIDVDRVPDNGLCRGCTLRLVSSDRLPNGEPLARLYESPVAFRLSYAGTADFELSKFDQYIKVYSREGSLSGEARLYLLGPVLSLALELKGIPSLHASAVAARGKGTAFVATMRAGKSTLAAFFVGASHPLLSDDILAITWRDGLVWANPSYPQMRLWPDEAQHFLGHYDDLDRVIPTLSKRRVPVGRDGFGSFCDQAQPVACLYLPIRRDLTEGGAEIEITPVSPQDAVIELVRHSFTAPIVEPLGMQSQRLDFFARMVQQVPMRRLVYPSGFEYLPRVREAILEDLASL